MRFFAFASVGVFVVACSGNTLDAGSNTDGGAGGTTNKSGDGGAGDETASSATPTCTVGQDQTCNAEATMSGLAGKCTASDRCTCNAGFGLWPGGKCGPGKGLGSSCTKSADCGGGLECLESTVHPKAGECAPAGKFCTVACDDRTQVSSCSTLFGPGVFCFAGCEGSAGVCGLTSSR